MKTEAENKRLFEEARELRTNIRGCLHDRAKNNSSKLRNSCSTTAGTTNTGNKSHKP